MHHHVHLANPIQIFKVLQKMHKLQIIRIRKLENQKFAYLPKNCFKKFYEKSPRKKTYSRGKYRENVPHAYFTKKKIIKFQKS